MAEVKEDEMWYLTRMELDTEPAMTEATCWLEEVGRPWIVAADWITMHGQAICSYNGSLLCGSPCGKAPTLAWSGPYSGVCWTLPHIFVLVQN